MNKHKYSLMENEELLEIIDKKDKEIDKLSTNIIDLTFKLNYNKQTELIEFVRELYQSCKSELNPVEDRFHKEVEKSPKEILTNLVNYIREFCKNNKIKL